MGNSVVYDVEVVAKMPDGDFRVKFLVGHVAKDDTGNKSLVAVEKK